LKTLVIGIGNPGRTDDGLGPGLVEKVESLGNPEIITSIDYQLNIEHAAEVAGAEVVIFVDASADISASFSFYRTYPAEKPSFTTHAMEPEGVLATCREVYGKLPPAFVLAIRGENFAIGEGLTRQAALNLEHAEKFLQGLLETEDILGRCIEAAGQNK
jgi:hydrogenase maturation protease